MHEHMTEPDVSDDIRWMLNPAMRIVPIAAEGGAAAYLLELDDRHGRTLRLSIGSEAMRLLESFRVALSWPECRRALSAAGHSDAELDAFAGFVAGPCRDRRILVEPGNTQDAADQPARPPYLNFMLTLLPPRACNALSARLQWLFSPAALALGVVAIIVAMLAMAGAMHATLVAPALDADRVLAVGVIAALGIVLHELGHATAAHRLGARRVSIGIGWYLVMPVAWSELSELWRYPRRARVIVDCAGVYMQGLVLVVLMVLHHAHGDALWLVAAGLTATSMLWNLNPFLRMDGYWIVADALGIHDLRRRAAGALRDLVGFVGGGSAVRARHSLLLLGYAGASGLFMVWLFYRATRFLIEAAVSTWPLAMERIGAQSIADLGASELLLGAVLALWQLLVAILALRFVAGAPRRVWHWWSGADKVAR
jgi:hypothetical protein